MPRTRARLPLSAPTAALVALVAVATAGRAVAAVGIDGLWIMPDEMVYGRVGLSIWEDGDLRVWGGEPRLYGLLYPALAGLPLAVGGLDAGYDALKVVQAALMCLTAVPVYLWARRLAGAWWGFAAAALTLAIPGFVYAGLIMSEVAAYPTMVLAAWATAAAIEHPSRTRQALLVGAVLIAAATRLQGLVLPFVLVTAIGLDALFARDARRPLRLWPALAALGALGLAWIAWRWGTTGSPAGALGSYDDVVDAGYGAAGVARSVLDHAAGILLITALFPACAVALLAVPAFAGREGSPAVRAYLATTISFTTWLLLQVGVFTSAYVDGLAERYLMPLAPLLFVGFAVWLARGAPRPRLVTGVVVLGALALVLALPLREVVVQEALIHSFVLVPLLWLRERASDSTLELAVWGGAAAALAFFALVPRRARVALPVVAVAVLAFASAAATREVTQNVAFDRQHLVGGEPRWVDAAAPGDVAYVYVGEQPANIVWHQAFWNRSIEEILALGGIGPATFLPVATPVEALPSGRLVPQPSAGYALAVDAATFVGEEVSRVEIQYGDQSGLVVWRLDPPARLSTLRTGIRDNGDLYGPAQVRAWDCAGGSLNLTLLPKSASRVELRANGEVVQTLALAGEPFVNATVPAPPGSEYCIFDIVPDSLLGTTVVEFARP